MKSRKMCLNFFNNFLTVQNTEKLLADKMCHKMCHFMSSISSRYSPTPMFKNMLLTYKLISYMVFACDDVPHCCKGTHAKTIQVYLDTNTCDS